MQWAIKLRKGSCTPQRIYLIIFLLFNSSILFSQDLENIAKAKPITFHGSTSLNVIGYSIAGIPARAEPFSFVLSAQATVSLYGIEMPFSITLSDKQKSYSQPFNQFGLSPRWKWITVHGGYRNITFSDFTLAGHTFLGGGIELTPSIFRFGFVYGRFDRKTSESPMTPNDSLPNFSSTGFAVKVGVGTSDNFCDLILLRIRDNQNSIQQSDTSAIRTPEQNVVGGINAHFTFFKKLVFEFEGAFSLYTTNLNAQTFEDVENNSTLRSLNKFLAVNQSSEYYSALRSSLSYTAKYYSLKLEYKRIAPKYRSMGAYYFNNDLENITFTPAFRFFKNKVNLSGSIGFQRDNLRNSKKATSMRTIGSVNLSVNPVQVFGVDINYSNYSINQKAGRIALIDSVRIVQTTHNLSISPRLMFISTKLSNVVSLTYNYSSFIDRNDVTSEFTQYNTNMANLVYVITLLNSQWSILSGLNVNQMKNYIGSTYYYGGSLGVSKSLLENKMNLSLNNSLNKTETTDQSGWTIITSLIANYDVTKQHSLRFNFNFTKNLSGNQEINPAFTEFKGDLMYIFTF